MGEAGFTVPRGMKDIEPREMARRIWLAEKIRDVLWNYGFQLVEPSALENLETLEAKSGPEIREQIYWFPDKSGRNLGLRFDLTVGMTRMVANRFDLPEPIKIASMGGNWRYEEPQFGRFRYFSQWDVEIFGVAEPSADAEIIAVGSDILEAVGLRDHEIRIGNRRLVEGFLRSVGIRSQAELEQVIRVVDKIARIGVAQARKELLAAGLSEETANKVLDFGRLAGNPEAILAEIRTKLPQDEMAKKGFTELAGTVEALGPLGKLSKCKVDMGIVRGIGYYDGTVFEGFDTGGEDLGSIFGGGRFDKLCRIYGKRDMPATGVAGGFERLIMSLERKNLFPNIEQNPVAVVAAVNESVWAEALKIVQALRVQGIRTNYDLKQRSLPKQLEYANALKARVAVIVGPKELKEGKVRLKDLRTGKENDVPTSSLGDQVRKVVG